jgi:hypothetical protein
MTDVLDPVVMACQIDDARTALRSLFGDRYRGLMAPWTAHLREVMAAHRLDALCAGMLLCRIATRDGDAPRHLTMFILGAVVEVLEGGP